MELFDAGLGHSGVNTARSALSATVTIVGCDFIGSHPLVRRLGSFQMKPAMPRYQSTWDVKLVLDYLSEMHPPRSLSLKDLTLKIVMLVCFCNWTKGAICSPHAY